MTKNQADILVNCSVIFRTEGCRLLGCGVVSFEVNSPSFLALQWRQHADPEL
jgi:hypothetical protein